MPLLAFHGDYDFSFVTPFTEVTQRFGHFAQLIGSVVPDNVHMGSDGSLITAGMVIDDPVCGSVQS